MFQRKFFVVLLPAMFNSSNAFVVSRSLCRNSNKFSLFSTAENIPKIEPVLSTPSAVSERVFSADKRPVILFDGVCNMCNSAVNLALDWDPQGKLRFAALQSNVGRALLQVNGRKADDISSIVLVSEDGAFIKSDAILRITEELTPKWIPLPVGPSAKLGRLLIPSFVRDLIYDGVADNRYSIMGVRDECRLDDGQFNDRFVDDALGIDA
mmetsp:Transcript_32793/g.64990  ORF Transcript_32793/g.64990 Transcript_32793/m.64990 type:complete len:210 (+) Transcript_32793:124-753(+)